MHVHTTCGHDAHPALVCAHCGEAIDPRELKVRPGPGAAEEQRAEGVLPAWDRRGLTAWSSGERGLMLAS